MYLIPLPNPTWIGTIAVYSILVTVAVDITTPPGHFPHTGKVVMSLSRAVSGSEHKYSFAYDGVFSNKLSYYGFNRVCQSDLPLVNYFLATLVWCGI